MTQNTFSDKYQKICDFIEGRKQAGGNVLLDGAMGTALFAQGLQSGDAPELWNIDQPAKIKTIYRNYLKNGSDIILTNSFGGNGSRLALHQLEGRVFELNQAAASLAREVIDECQADGTIDNEPHFVAGSIGPTGALLQPMGPMSKQEAQALFFEQCKGLEAGGADLGWVETMALLDEAEAAYYGAVEAGLPAAITLSFDMNGKTMMGVTEQEFCAFANNLDPKPVAIGFNCGLGFSDSLVTLAGLLTHADGLPVIAKSNCGLPVFKEDKICFEGTPELMKSYAVMARNGGAMIIGGCCGTTADHVGAMKQALMDTPKQDKKLERAQIEEIFGAANAPTNQSVAQIEAEIEKRKSGRRRNRS